MVSSKIILSPVLIFITVLAAQAQIPAADWSIADYFKNLPEKYLTASGDYAKPSAETVVFDEPNGYAVAHLNGVRQIEPDEPTYPIFEMALFKSQIKPPLVVVANSINDHVCTDYETFFLQRVGSKWTEVKREVLPPMNLKMFWDATQSAARLLKIIKESSTSYHFKPPRHGTRMKVSLEICDYLEDDVPEETGKELRKLIESAKPIYLEWDKQNGKFKFAK